jgi:hypothetical protein
MSDDTERRYVSTKAEYHRLVQSYVDALSEKDPIAGELFVQATVVWVRLREFGREEARLDFDMHLVLAFSGAIQAGDAVEAKRLYDAMSDDYRRTTDGADALEPGSMKIWLTK